MMVLYLLLISIVTGNIIGIDFGSQFIKVAYQTYSRPPEIVTDPSGKRKIDNAVFFDENVRVYGNNAKSHAITKPEYVFIGMNELLGQGTESAIPAVFQQRGFPYEFVQTKRNTWSLKLLSGSGFPDYDTVTVEELNAMILDYLVSIVEKEFEEKGREVVIAVPTSFSQTQRQALLDAANLANIKVHALLDQTTASAITYAMTRTGEGIKRVLVYDVGSHHTEVSAVEIETVRKDKVFSRNVVVLGKESMDVGGEDFTNGVLSILRDRYEQQFHHDPFDDLKLHARLRMQSEKYKEVLSANREVLVNEASVWKGEDLRFMLTRAEFEEEVTGVLSKVLLPFTRLEQKLKLKLKLTTFDEIQLMGGSSRLPLFQSELEKVVAGRVPIYTHLNTDDSVALGCVYYWNTKYAKNRIENVYEIPTNIVMTTIYRPMSSLDSNNTYDETNENGDDDPTRQSEGEDISMRDRWIQRELELEEEEDYIVANQGQIPSFVLFSEQSGYQRQQTFSFPVKKDFRIAIHTPEFISQPSSFSSLESKRPFRNTIRKYQVSGIEQLIQSLDNHLESNVTLVFQWDEMGLVKVKKVELVSKYVTKEDRIAYQRKISSIFYRYRKYDPHTLLHTRTRTDSPTLTDLTDNLVILPSTSRTINRSRRVLKEMAYRDKKSLEAQKSLNELESMMYDIELSMEEDEFVQFATEDEKSEVLASVKAIKQYVKKVMAKEIEFQKRGMRREVRKATEIVERVMERAAVSDRSVDDNVRDNVDSIKAEGKGESEEVQKTEIEAEL